MDLEAKIGRVVELNQDWHKFMLQCNIKMIKHIDRTYRDNTIQTLFKKLKEEWWEFLDSMTYRNNDIFAGEVEDFDEIELLDIANMCMMLYTVKKLQRKLIT